jgi:hypothetical protein
MSVGQVRSILEKSDVSFPKQVQAVVPRIDGQDNDEIDCSQAGHLELSFQPTTGTPDKTESCALFKRHDALDSPNAVKQLKSARKRRMALFKKADFDERRNAAEAAKKVKLEKFRAMTAQINEGAAERLAARQAIIAARDLRTAEREAARHTAKARAAEAHAAREMGLKAEQAERDASAAGQVEREVASAAERKAARDARYAARKARK